MVKYTGRLWSAGLIIISGIFFKIHTFVTLGYIPMMEWILNALFLLPGWWCGLQYDKSQYLAKELKEKEAAVNRLLVKRLEETEQRFKSLFVQNPDPIFTFNIEGKLIDANQAAEKLLGYTVEELQKLSWKTIVVPEDMEKQRLCYKRVSKGISQKFIISLFHKDGRVRDVKVTMIPIIIDETFIGFYEIARDITDSKKTEEMIRRSDKLSAIGQLAAGVAHEIRNPLTTLRGFVQLLIPEKDKQHKDIMLEEIDRINLIVSEFLILAKPQDVKYQQRDLNQILQTIISLLEAQANIRNIQFSTQFEPDLPAIDCEENQLKQVFINLLKNAIEAMPNGGKIHVESHGIDDKMVSVKVTDSGVGIPNELIPKLGEPFNTTKEDGNGLGLMVCSRIIESHGGTINISSEPNKGTCVEVILPVNGRFKDELIQ